MISATGCVRTPPAPMARVECEQMKEGKTYTAEVKRKYDKRSGRCNAYAWSLMGKLAAKLGIKREEVYRQYIPEIGDNFRLVPYVNGQQRDFIKEQGIETEPESTVIGWLSKWKPEERGV